MPEQKVRGVRGACYYYYYGYYYYYDYVCGRPVGVERPMPRSRWRTAARCSLSGAGIDHLVKQPW